MGDQYVDFDVRIRNDSDDPFDSNDLSLTAESTRLLSIKSIDSERLEPNQEATWRISCNCAVVAGEQQIPLDIDIQSRGHVYRIQRRIKFFAKPEGGTAAVPQIGCDFATLHRGSSSPVRSTSLLLHSNKDIDPAALKVTSPNAVIKTECMLDQISSSIHVAETKVFQVPLWITLSPDELPLGQQTHWVEVLYGSTKGRLPITCNVLPKWALGNSACPATVIISNQCLPNAFKVTGPSPAAITITAARVVSPEIPWIKLAIEGDQLKVLPLQSSVDESNTVKHTLEVVIDVDGAQDTFQSDMQVTRK